jgi:hypothetical protein
MPRYRKRPVEVEAMRLIAHNGANVAAWCDGTLATAATDPDQPVVAISTLEGTMVADVGDWVICGVAGEFYPCKPDIFEATYEPVEG